MASDKGAVVSGADFDTQATRRRNVPSTSPNSGLVNRVEIDEKKTQAKQVSNCLRLRLRTNSQAMKAFKEHAKLTGTVSTEPTIDSGIP